MDSMIKVEGLSKQYQLGALQESYTTLREALGGALRAPLRRLRRGGAASGETLWALKDVTFRVAPGEVVGLIGRNGAGKSTLLKILSRITEPSAGRVELYGRVGSLLEVGTGFHPELTGRENIFLNGAILGMGRAEIRNRFDEIVAFSELEKFIDTPVKRYSSGMYVRLAFAVAAYLEPDILVVDEVLAVGDLAFQKRCLGKMQDVTRQGRTVIFVSHNVAAIKTLCSRALLLKSGRVTCDGGVDEVVDTYLMAGGDVAETGVVPDDAHDFGTGEVWVRKVELFDRDGNPVKQVYFGQPVRVALTLEVKEDIEDAVISVGLSTLDGMRVTSSYSIDRGQPPVELPAGWYRVLVDLNVTLIPRRYAIDAAVSHMNGAVIDLVNSTLQFEALSVAEAGDDHYRWGTVHGSIHGFVRMDGRWQVAEAARELADAGAVAPG
ncbi:MAG TPA: ABC transporter ATP-binding protein [Pyrinomonadaceae bacterium]|nr:ABC transporter ATP-binding protein [Pyrinomonadaceae bacterium]